MAKGMNMGILALLVVITSVLAGVATFFVYLARRNPSLPSDASLSDQVADPISEPQSELTNQP